MGAAGEDYYVTVESVGPEVRRARQLRVNARFDGAVASVLAVIAAGFHVWMLLSGEPIETPFGSTAVVGLAAAVVTLGLAVLAVTSDDLDTVDTCRRAALGAAALSLITTMFGLMVISGFMTAAWSGHRPRAPWFEPKPQPGPTLPGLHDYLRPALLPVIVLIALGLADVGPAAVYGIYALVALLVILPDASILYRTIGLFVGLFATAFAPPDVAMTALEPVAYAHAHLRPMFGGIVAGEAFFHLVVAVARWRAARRDRMNL